MSEIEMAEGTFDDGPKVKELKKTGSKKRSAKAKAKRDPRTTRDATKKPRRGEGRQVIALDGDVIMLIRKKQGEIQAKTGRRITMSEAATIAIRGK